jgi:hypothetical protein
LEDFREKRCIAALLAVCAAASLAAQQAPDTPAVAAEEINMFHKVKKAKTLPTYCLLVQFENGEKKRYDLKPLFKEIAAFQPLTYVTGLFEQVKVDSGGYGISWNDDIDLACDELYNNGTK